MTDTIRFSQQGSIARLTLNHAERHNALGREQLDAMEEIFASLESGTDARVLVLDAVGDKTFCAGASLHELSAGDMGDNAFQRMTARLAALHVPTICAIGGNVFGGGVELAASCDFRIAVEGIRMRVPAASLGLCYPLEGIHRFVECVGVAATRRILVASETLHTADLQQIGFIDRLVTREVLEREVDAFAQHIAGLAPLAVRSMNHILRQISTGNLDADQAHDLVASTLESADLQEGFAAQREKRAPQFRGV
ncbi:MAG: enoyl-CoA hydratase-related protein [Gammaproteobacteria bacterium]|nr:enoyl-CoA hydratase-related protein [Gammaproteobacteria bacterium]